MQEPVEAPWAMQFPVLAPRGRVPLAAHAMPLAWRYRIRRRSRV
jgi:hypothetical protein